MKVVRTIVPKISKGKLDRLCSGPVTVSLQRTKTSPEFTSFRAYEFAGIPQGRNDPYFRSKASTMSAQEGPENKGAITFAVVYTILAMLFISGLILFG